jgi:hypothetical protein
MNSKLNFLLAIVLASLISTTMAFAPNLVSTQSRNVLSTLQARIPRKITDSDIPIRKINNERRKKLGIADDEDEYDLDFALENNTDPFISKLIAGSLILSITALLVYGIVIPATTDYGEGICNALLTGGRC